MIDYGYLSASDRKGFSSLSITLVWKQKPLTSSWKFYQDVTKFLVKVLCLINFLFSVKAILLYATVPEEVVVALDSTLYSDVSGPVA